MRLHEIEHWALRIIDQVVNNKPDEDSRIELKREWPDAQKAARQIAGHANSCRGEPILWLIGVDEGSQSVPGVSPNELSIWYNQVKSQFDEKIAPSLVDLNVPYKGVVVVALYFDASRIPYVVKIKNPKGGEILEVPWREGTEVRTARREDLIRLLTPVHRIPKVELLSANLSVIRHFEPRDDVPLKYKWELTATYYFEADVDSILVIPFHRCNIEAQIADKLALNFRLIGLFPPAVIDTGKKIVKVFPTSEGFSNQRSFSETMKSTDDELFISGPGKVYMKAEYFSSGSTVEKSNETITVAANLAPIQTAVPIQIHFDLVAAQPRILSEDNEEVAYWSF